MGHLPYIRFLALAQEFNAENPTIERCLPVLAYIASQQLANKSTKYSDLVNRLDYGTGPTVLKKVTTLIKGGYLSSSEAPRDNRTKLLTVTESGFELLSHFGSFMEKALKT
jgi:DNA-binding MarR family transcriptional regulator